MMITQSKNGMAFVVPQEAVDIIFNAAHQASTYLQEKCPAVYPDFEFKVIIGHSPTGPISEVKIIRAILSKKEWDE